MAKINQYPAKTVPSNNDEFILHDPSSGSTKKMTRGDLIGGAPLPAKSVTLPAINGGTTAGVLTTGASGGVSAAPSLIFRGVDTKTSTNTVLTTSWVAYATVTASTSGGDVLLTWSADIRDSNSGATRTGSVRVFIDGTAVGALISYYTPNALKDTPSLTQRLAVPAGSHTFTLRLIADTASATYLNQASLLVQEIVGS